MLTVDHFGTPEDFRDYFKGVYGPTIAVYRSLADQPERAAALDAEVEPVPIPWDCVDGFFHAFWRRPHTYLQEPVRRGTSVWARVGPRVERRAVRALGADLASGAWHERHGGLLNLTEADLGARLVTAAP